jgi:phage-related protein
LIFRRQAGSPAVRSSLPKPLGWRGSALDDVRALAPPARHAIGIQLNRLQQGELAEDWRPMPIVGPGTIELRTHRGGEYRVFVVCKFKEAIYVLHAFEKRSRQTTRADTELGRKRYRDLVTGRGSR